jgi:glycosidase
VARSIGELGSDFGQVRTPRTRGITIEGHRAEIRTPFPSPEDWRDIWIYFVMVDRFDNPMAPPRHDPWDGEHGSFQAGTLAGVRGRLGYLKELGAGAVWLSPVLKNCQFDEGSYHGYGIQDFLVVDPRFCSDPERARTEPAFAEGELRQLVDEAHARGLYVILDIVLNHTGDVFEYEGFGSEAPWRDDPPYPIRWRDQEGRGRPDWNEAPADPPADAAVWPAELRRNDAFRRRGNAFTRPGALGELGGDFFSLKELATDLRDEDGGFPVRATLIRAHQSAIARFDLDGFRIDTLKYVERDFARVFGNAMREFALSIGKRNFFTFGEVYDEEDKIAGFIGRPASDAGDLIGVDAALDFPLFFRLPGVAKGLLAPKELAAMYERRKQVQAGVISSHGEASGFFVTFLDNHDQNQRFYFSDTADPHRFDDQVTLALGCLFGLQGIPCLYYGTEQGLHGAGGRPEAVREALWGKPGAFDLTHPFAQACRDFTRVRAANPALRYGRQYFRPISGDGVHFGLSSFPGGVVAFSRVLNDLETLVVANTNTESAWSGEVIVDRFLHKPGAAFVLAYSNKGDSVAVPPEPVSDKLPGQVQIHEVSGAVTSGPARTLTVSPQPDEVQILTGGRLAAANAAAEGPEELLEQGRVGSGRRGRRSSRP